MVLIERSPSRSKSVSGGGACFFVALPFDVIPKLAKASLNHDAFYRSSSFLLDSASHLVVRELVSESQVH